MPVTPNRTIDDTRTTDRTTVRQEGRRLERPSRSAASGDGSLFSIDKGLVPPGYVMEWKRHEVMGFSDRHNQVVIQQNHWTPVPHKMQPQKLGHLCKDPEEHIIVGGEGLYMRPTYLNEDAAAEQREETDYTLNQQLQALKLSSKDQVGERFTKIKRATLAPQTVE